MGSNAGRGSNRHGEERDFQGPLYAKSRVFALSFLRPPSTAPYSQKQHVES